MKIVFASHNPNKIKEIKLLLPPSIELLSLADIGCTQDIAETADTIEGNAQIKATYIKDHYGFDCFADDTGLEVDALDGAPGVYSARYAGPQKIDAENIQKLLRKLAGNSHRSAQFKTVIALSNYKGTHLFTGICKGIILKEPKGKDGFGYDPIFQPIGYPQSFAEMPTSLKNQISHRKKALEKLIVYLQAQKK